MRMKNISLLIFGIFLIGIVSAVTCCEKTTTGAWCQNADTEAECDTGINPINGESYRVINAFCEATSYCRTGTCVNNKDGTCMPNTPEIVCEENYGFWSEKTKSELPQCKLGCCLMGDSAAFVTQVACNRMSSLYGLTINYRADITSELECLESANPSAKGACVYTKELAKTCEISTRKDCTDKKESSTLSEVEFHEGFLCSANELGTICARSQSTRCEGDDVYFVDTCGNLANIYDSSKINDESYWKLIQEPVCGDEEGNKDSSRCGDCDYYSGSMCKQKGVGDSVSYGNYICKDLDCKSYTGFYSGTGNPKHGESWCATDTETEDFVPGSTHYRLLCYNGEVTTEICDTTRQKICAEAVVDEETGFKTGNCRVNEWQTCTSQNTSVTCEDATLRDCVWKEYAGYEFSENGLINTGLTKGMCVPKYPPGFERDGSGNTIGSEICNLANTMCSVKMEKKILENENQSVCDVNKPGSNCTCLDEYDDESRYVWRDELNKICVSLGDCGSKVNYAGNSGYEQSEIISILKGEY